MKEVYLTTMILCSTLIVSSCSTPRFAYKYVDSFTVVSDCDVSKVPEYIHGFISDREDSYDSQIVIWRSVDPKASELTLNRRQEVIGIEGVNLNRLREVRGGLFTISQEGQPRKLPLPAVRYVWIAETAKSGDSEELAYLSKNLKDIHLYNNVALHEKTVAESVRRD